MEIKKEFVTTLFDNEVRTKASQMFGDGFEHKGHKDRMPIDMYNISFRLYRPSEQNVNLEFMATSPVNGRYYQPWFLKRRLI
ncbi:MAG: hypothetical protein IPM82_22770 [Saprospiraceae bacterium]|nr:hypothetical protein [Saprospiraceae bacterium]